jgi:hypothetical protein
MCPFVYLRRLLLANESASVVNPTLILSHRNSSICAFDPGRTSALSIACAVIKSPSPPAEGKGHMLGIEPFHPLNRFLHMRSVVPLPRFAREHRVQRPDY